MYIINFFLHKSQICRKVFKILYDLVPSPMYFTGLDILCLILAYVLDRSHEVRLFNVN